MIFLRVKIGKIIRNFFFLFHHHQSIKKITIHSPTGFFDLCPYPNIVVFFPKVTQFPGKYKQTPLFVFSLLCFSLGSRTKLCSFCKNCLKSFPNGRFAALIISPTRQGSRSIQVLPCNILWLPQFSCLNFGSNFCFVLEKRFLPGFRVSCPMVVPGTVLLLLEIKRAHSTDGCW